MRKLIVLSAFLVIICAQLFSIETNEQIPAEIQRAEAQFIQRINNVYAPLSLDKKSGLFSRKGKELLGSKQNYEESKSVFDILKAEQLEHISFNETRLSPFDDRGTCSAMALDFAARFNTACASNPDPEARRKCVEAMAPYYEYSNSTYISRQAAYNTIEIKDYNYDEVLSFEQHDELKMQKMASLANYHGLSITPVTETLIAAVVYEHEEILINLINSFSNGTYVFRMLSPGPTVKHEYYGHTMIFVKGDDFSAFYDNGVGANDISEDPAKGVLDALWAGTEFRIYRVECPNGGCRNFSDSCSFN